MLYTISDTVKRVCWESTRIEKQEECFRFLFDMFKRYYLPTLFSSFQEQNIFDFSQPSKSKNLFTLLFFVCLIYSIDRSQLPFQKLLKQKVIDHVDDKLVSVERLSSFGCCNISAKDKLAIEHCESIKNLDKTISLSFVELVFHQAFHLRKPLYLNRRPRSIQQRA